MILMMGVNDLNSGRSFTKTLDGLAALIRDARSVGAEVFLSTLPPQDPRGFRGGNADAIPFFNADLTARAPSHGRHA